MRLRGRHWVVLWLMLFLGTALAITSMTNGGMSVVTT